MWTWLQCPRPLSRFKYSLNRRVAEEKVLTDLDEQKTEVHFSQAIKQSVQKYLLSTFSVSGSAQGYGHITGNKTKPQDLKEPMLYSGRALKVIQNAESKNSSSS